jgi:hypothetical protein
MTLATDYVLAGVTGWLAWLLWRQSSAQSSRQWWSISFAGLALAAALGGTHHGFAPHMSETVAWIIWKLTVLSIGGFSVGILTGSAIASTSGTLRGVLLAAAWIKATTYWSWMALHDEYRYVIVDTAITMAALVLLHAGSYLAHRDRASAWVLGAIAVSTLAAIVQFLAIAPHAHFNHNDLYHIIQIAAMALFYQGGKLLHDRI